MIDRHLLRHTFNRVAELYDRARPAYPHAVFDDLDALATLPDRARVLEIGCGTGQATLPMAQRGYRITAVELGPELARVARRNLADYADVDVQAAEFESWPLPAEPFHLVFAATAFHWLDPAVRYEKSARALRPGGSLAVLGGGHIAGGDEQFFVDVQDCYERFMPGTPPGLRLQAADEIPPDTDALIASGIFEPPVVRRYEWERAFTTETYLGELNTYSNHIALDDEARGALLACVGSLINARYGGRIRKRYLTELVVAEKAGGRGT